MSLPSEPKRTARAAKPFTAEQAREEILRKAHKGGAKGVSGFFTPKTAAAKREALEGALAALETEGAVVVDRRKKKPRYHHAEFPPQFPEAGVVAAKLGRAASERPRELFNAAELKRTLARDERELVVEGLGLAVARGWLLELRRKKAVFYIGTEPIRGALALAEAGTAAATVEAEPVAAAEGIREAYHVLVRDSGFPAVAVAALQAASGAPMAGLKEWILAEHRRGGAVLSFGDWSLADEAKRAGAIELAGERYLLVRLSAGAG